MNLNIKAFHAYRIRPKSFVDFLETSLVKMHEASPAADPTAGQWRKLGFVDVLPGVKVFHGASRSRVVSVEISERVLPGQVLRNEVLKRVAVLSERGEIINKKRVAEVRDVVEAELLVKSHIKSTRVNVIITDDLIVVGTGSPKVADDIIGLFRNSTPNVLFLSLLSGHKGILQWLSAITRDGDDLGVLEAASITPKEEEAFEAGGSILLKGDRDSARFNDVPVNDPAVIAAIEGGLSHVAELAVNWRNTMKFKITDKLVFRGLKFSDLSLAESKAGVDEADAAAMFDAQVFLFATYVGHMITQLEDGMLLFAPKEATKEEDDHLIGGVFDDPVTASNVDTDFAEADDDGDDIDTEDDDDEL